MSTATVLVQSVCFVLTPIDVKLFVLMTTNVHWVRL